jgi:hypothetical protein
MRSSRRKMMYSRADMPAVCCSARMKATDAQVCTYHAQEDSRHGVGFPALGSVLAALKLRLADAPDGETDAQAGYDRDPSASASPFPAHSHAKRERDGPNDAQSKVHGHNLRDSLRVGIHIGGI